mmetsp:Transcript_40638/g.98829  ORF Transcript_40638/g.98829 Transcript_40638/m.98829 type:complete len:226 (-) Transcript_40638:234-911(-)
MTTRTFSPPLPSRRRVLRAASRTRKRPPLAASGSSILPSNASRICGSFPLPILPKTSTAPSRMVHDESLHVRRIMALTAAWSPTSHKDVRLSTTARRTRHSASSSSERNFSMTYDSTGRRSHRAGSCSAAKRRITASRCVMPLCNSCALLSYSKSSPSPSSRPSSSTATWLEGDPTDASHTELVGLFRPPSSSLVGDIALTTEPRRGRVARSGASSDLGIWPIGS